MSWENIVGDYFLRSALVQRLHRERMLRTAQRLVIFGFVSCLLVITVIYRHTAYDFIHTSLFSTDALTQRVSDTLQHYTPNVHSSLVSPLQSFLRGPLLTYELALPRNELTCGTKERADRQVNPDQLRKQKLFWRGVGNLEVAMRRIAIVKYLEEAGGHTSLLGKPGGGRGIVMTGGNKVLVSAHTISCLRGI